MHCFGISEKHISEQVVKWYPYKDSQIDEIYTRV